MAGQHSNTLLAQLRGIVGPPDAGESDAELLERWLTRRDESAFELLVWRHGGLVLGVCQRILRHPPDVEDAFQATFLIFVRKASTISKAASVGAWFYRVAYRIALEAKAQARRRDGGSPTMVERAAPCSPDPLTLAELRQVLDEELDRLPEKYRRPVVLCYLEGKTTDEAAQALDRPRGTVLTWLARAREKLQRRLAHRGTELSAVALGGLLGSQAQAAVTPALVQGAVKVALGAGVSQQVQLLSKGVLWAMWLSKLKYGAWATLLLLGIGVGTGLFWHRALAADGTDDSAPVQVAQLAKGAKKATGADEIKKELEKFVGDWKIVEMEFSGQKVPAKVAEQLKESFTTEKLTMVGGLAQGGGEFVVTDRTEEISFKIDPTKRPRAIDLLLANDKKLLGIYEFKGDALRMCIDYAATERPTEFTSKGKEGVSYTVLKREKK
ncbi:MAG: sigma-70 family RNA polymerase sigma factor [Planctomycetes bacterium]|nr:sigma-70 family RNA polymerase sigma factor [Planctomycetota bacterium]